MKIESIKTIVKADYLKNINTFLALSFIVCIISLYYFYTYNYIILKKYAVITTTLWLSSIIIWTAGIFIVNGKKESYFPNTIYSRKTDIIIIFSLIIVALLLRLYKIDHNPLFFQASIHYNEAKGIVEGTILSPFGFSGDTPSNIQSFFVTIPYIFLDYYDYLSVSLTGIFFSLLNIVICYFLVKTVFNRATAIVACSFIVFSFWDIHDSKGPWLNVTISPPLITGSMLFLYLGLVRKSLKHLFAAGVFIGISINLLYLACINVAALVIYSLIELIKSKSKSHQLRLLFFIFFTTFLFISPTLIKVFKYQYQSISRHEKMINNNIEQAKQAGKGITHYFNQASITVKRFIFIPDKYKTNTFQHWGITINYFVQAFFILGLFISFLNTRKRQYYLFNISFIILFTPLVIVDRGVSVWREFGFLSHIYIYSAIGITGFYTLATRYLKRFNINHAINYILIGTLITLYLFNWIIDYRVYAKENLEKQNFPYEYQCKVLTLDILANVPKDVTIILPDELCYPLAKVRLGEKYIMKRYSNFKDLDSILSNDKKSVIVKLPVSWFSNNFSKTTKDKDFDDYVFKRGFTKSILETDIILYKN